VLASVPAPELPADPALPADTPEVPPRPEPLPPRPEVPAPALPPEGATCSSELPHWVNSPSTTAATPSRAAANRTRRTLRKPHAM